MYRAEIDKLETKRNIESFMNLSSIAFVGISSKERDFSRSLYRDMKKQIQQVIPVNPNVSEIDEDPCYSSLREIGTELGGVFIITSPSNAKAVVQDCIDLGIKNIWFHRGVGQGSINDEIYHLALDNGINIVPGYCPYMFFSNTGFGHKLHGWFLKLTGKYPN
jgi:predicted CoA-binding protein